VTVASVPLDSVPFPTASHLIKAELFAIQVTSVVPPLGMVHLISYTSGAVECSAVEIYHDAAALGVSVVVTMYKYFIVSVPDPDPLLTYTLDNPNESSVSTYVPIAMCVWPQDEAAICTWNVLCAANPTAQASDVFVALDKQPDNRDTRIDTNKHMRRGCVYPQENVCICIQFNDVLHGRWMPLFLYIDKQCQISRLYVVS